MSGGYPASAAQTETGADPQAAAGLTYISRTRASRLGH
jgi:hypothetical protein